MPVFTAVVNGGTTLIGPASDGTNGQVLITDGNGNLSFTADVGGAFSADADTQITASTAIVLDHASNNEIALALSYTTNKAAGNDTGLLINQTDTASPGTSYLIDAQVGGSSKLVLDNAGQLGIGTSSPQRLLHLDGGANSYVRLGTSSAQSDGLFGADANGSLVLFSIDDNKYRLKLHGDGSFGIGPMTSTDPDFADAAVSADTSKNVTIGANLTLSDGTLSITETATGSSPLQVTSPGSATAASVVVNMGSSQTGDAFDIKDSGGSSKFTVDKDGDLTIDGGGTGITIINGGRTVKTDNNQSLRLQDSNTQANTSPLVEIGQSCTFTDDDGDQVCLKVMPTYNQSGTAGATDLLINRTETAVGSGSQYLIQAQVGGTDVLTVDNAGTVANVGKLEITSSLSNTRQILIDSSNDAIVRLKRGGHSNNAYIQMSDGFGGEWIAGTVDNATDDYCIGPTDSNLSLVIDQSHNVTLSSDLTLSDGTLSITETDTGSSPLQVTSPGSATAASVVVTGGASQTGELIKTLSDTGAQDFTVASDGKVQIGVTGTTSYSGWDTALRVSNPDENGQIALTRMQNGATGPLFFFEAARGSHGSPATLTSGDGLGSIYYYGYDGTSWDVAGRLRFVADTVSAGDITSRTDFYFADGGTQDAYLAIGPTSISAPTSSTPQDVVLQATDAATSSGVAGGSVYITPGAGDGIGADGQTYFSGDVTFSAAATAHINFAGNRGEIRRQGVNQIEFGGAWVSINQDQSNVDTYIKSDNANAIFVDAALDTVTLNVPTTVTTTDTGATPLTVTSAASPTATTMVVNAAGTPTGDVAKFQVGGTDVLSLSASTSTLLLAASTGDHATFEIKSTTANKNPVVSFSDTSQGSRWLLRRENGGAVLEVYSADNSVAMMQFQEAANAINLNSHLERSTTAGITASVTQTQVGGTALTSDVNEISVCANTNDTVVLPTAAAGRTITVINNGAQTAQVFPASGDDLGGGVDTATTIVSGAHKRFQAYDATNWIDIT